MRDATQRIYLFSVFNSKRTPKGNEDAHRETIEALKLCGYSVHDVSSSKSKLNESAILMYGTNLTEPVVADLVNKNFQESYVVIHPISASKLSDTELVFGNGVREWYGIFTESDEKYAKSCAWHMKIGNHWFIIDPYSE